jgi:hypothetical protein
MCRDSFLRQEADVREASQDIRKASYMNLAVMYLILPNIVEHTFKEFVLASRH